MVVHSFKFNTQEQSKADLWVWGQQELHRKILYQEIKIKEIQELLYSKRTFGLRDNSISSSSVFNKSIVPVLNKILFLASNLCCHVTMNRRKYWSFSYKMVDFYNSIILALTLFLLLTLICRNSDTFMSMDDPLLSFLLLLYLLFISVRICKR